uniref:Uncharacterized protein n=1 Tax=Candidatus Kentrum sp. LPFa TaxID=2126335 RepID=A0A450XFK5_9GAMM|nr:MAG: hypothetical protein BECKLPF1236A_GA0070988_106212 [Candidatus Kentron sp. LPFa]
MRFAYPPYGPESGLLFHSKISVMNHLHYPWNQCQIQILIHLQ